MSRVIRTAHVTGRAVTLGAEARDLFVDPDVAEKAETALNLTAILDRRAVEERDSLTREWETRLRREHEVMAAAAKKQQTEAEERRQSEVAEVHEQRYEEGRAAGMAEREAEATEAVNRLAVLHEALSANRRQVLLEAEELVVDLAIDIAHKVSGIRAEIDPKVLARVMRRALAHLSERSNLVLKVHPDDLRIARKFAKQWVERVASDAVLKVLTSDHVGRGGCMIEGTEEFVDARLREQFSTLHDELRVAVKESQELAENGGDDELQSAPTPPEAGDESAGEQQSSQ